MEDMSISDASVSQSTDISVSQGTEEPTGFTVVKQISRPVRPMLTPQTYVDVQMSSPRSEPLSPLPSQSVMTEIPDVGSGGDSATREATVVEPVSKQRLIEMFEALILCVRSEKEKGWEYRISNYQRAIDSLRSYPGEAVSIADIREAFHRAGFKNPAGLLKKAEEILTTGTLHCLQESGQPSQALRELTSVPWIGEKTAQKLIAQGITSLVRLQEETHRLTHAQQMGVRYYMDLMENVDQPRRIPREEIEELANYLERNWPNPREWTLAGSFRRGHPTSGDVDLVITGNLTMSKLLFLLKKRFKLEMINHGTQKYLGLIKLKLWMRRLDVLYTSEEEYPFAVLYLTGSKEFNKKMRIHALESGCSLSEHGLVWSSSRVKVGETFTSERDIFAWLEIPYVPPEQRE